MEPQMELVDSVPAPEAPAPSPAPTQEAQPTPTEATPVEATVPEAPAPEPQPALVALPDGRMVTPDVVAQEYKNLLSDYTRKSQELATLKTSAPITKETPPWKDPNYAPADWAEAIEIAKAEALKEITERQQAEQAKEAEKRSAIEATLNEIKATDPKLDTDALFEHASKYGFSDLKIAHSNYKAMKEVALTTEQRVLKNIQTRAADPIATTPAAPVVAKPVEYTPTSHSNFRGALDFLESLKANK